MTNPGDGSSPAVISHVAVFAARSPGSGTVTDTFTVQAHAAGNAIVMQVGCAANATPTSVSVTAPGWTWTQLGPILANTASTERAAIVVAIAPDASPIQLTVHWTGSTCGSSVNDLGDEFAMTDPAGGMITFDSAVQTQGQGPCTGMITTGHASDVVWGACDTSNGVSSVGAGFTKSADDGAGDWSEYKVTIDPAGTVETPSFANANNGFVVSMVTLKPS
ncbi:MAG: hypothetical protein ABI467_18650 [Kofleriaceae bacterium]